MITHEGAHATAILNAVRDLPFTSDKIDPDHRMWDAIGQLAQLDAMITRLEAAGPVRAGQTIRVDGGATRYISS